MSDSLATSSSETPNLELAAAPALGKSLGRGATWMVISSIVTKSASFIAFAVLLRVLSERDMAVWGMAFSFAAFTQAFRDGGVAILLVRKGDKEYPALMGPVFWMGLAFNLGCALVLAGLAPLQAAKQNEPRLTLLLWLIAIAMPLATPASVLGARLSMQLRFRALSLMQMISSLVRSGGNVALALMGMGPMSLVAPLPAIAVFESGYQFALTRDKPWTKSPRFDLWPALFNQGKWLMFVALAIAVMNQGTIFALGEVLGKTDDGKVQLGILSVSYQLVSQVDQLLTATAAAVLFPAMALLNNEPERQKAAILRASRMLCFVACAGTMVLAVCMMPVERFMWGGKWDQAIWPTQALLVCYIERVLFFIPLVVLQAQGQFKLCALLTLAAGLGQMGAAAIAALIWPHELNKVGAVLAVYLFIGYGVFTIIGMRCSGVRGRELLRETIPTWLLACTAGVVGFATQRWLHPRLEWWAPPGVRSFVWSHLSGELSAKVLKCMSAANEGLIVAAVFGVAFTLLMRLFSRRLLREVVDQAPGRLHKFLRWV